MTTLLLSQDLMLVSQVTQTANLLEQCAEPFSSVAALVARCHRGDVSQIVLDLTMPGLDAGQVIEQFKQADLPLPRLLAVGPHVHTSRLDAARAAGCAQVLTRGQFHRSLTDWLRGV